MRSGVRTVRVSRYLGLGFLGGKTGRRGLSHLARPAALLRREHGLDVPAEFGQNDPVAAFRQGILTNILNPKVALFFLAFLPQFIDLAAPSKMTAFLVLGFAFVTTATIWCLVLAWFAAKFSERLRGNATVAAMLNRAVGSLFIFLGLRLALAARR